MDGKSDGSIVIDTEIDLEGIMKGIDEINHIVDSFAKKVKVDFIAINKNMEKTASSTEQLEKSFSKVGEAAESNIETTSDEFDYLDDIVKRAVDKANQQAEGFLDGGALYEPVEIGVTKLAASFDELEQSMKEASSEADNLGDKLEDKATPGLKDYSKESESASKQISSMTIAFGQLIAKGIEMTISALKDVMSKTKEYREDLAKLNNNAKLAGVGLDTTREAMKSLNAITGETDSNVEALSNLLQAGFKDNNLQSAVDALSGAVLKFPDTLKIESLADSLQETIATKEATGQFAEMLERVGINVDNFNRGLQRASKSGKEQDYVLSTLAGNGLAKVNEAYRKNNKELVDHANAQFELNEQLAYVSEQLAPIVVSALETISNFIAENKETIANWANLISSVVGIILELITALTQIPAPVYAVIGGILLGFTAFMKISTAIMSVSNLLSAFGVDLIPLNLSMLKTTAIIIGVVIALIALAAIITVAMGKSKELGNTFEGISNMAESVRNQVSAAQKPSRGYASGTLSAPRGRAWVGENGPELVEFRGGERVYNATQSRAMMAASNRTSVTYVTNYNNFPLNDLKALTEVNNYLQNQRQDFRMGYSGR